MLNAWINVVFSDKSWKVNEVEIFIAVDIVIILTETADGYHQFDVLVIDIAGSGWWKTTCLQGWKKQENK